MCDRERLGGGAGLGTVDMAPRPGNPSHIRLLKSSSDRKVLQPRLRLPVLRREDVLSQGENGTARAFHMFAFDLFIYIYMYYIYVCARACERGCV